MDGYADNSKFYEASGQIVRQHVPHEKRMYLCSTGTVFEKGLTGPKLRLIPIARSYKVHRTRHMFCNRVMNI